MQCKEQTARGGALSGGGSERSAEAKHLGAGERAGGASPPSVSPVVASPGDWDPVQQKGTP